jgi:hypothetical protein
VVVAPAAGGLNAIRSRGAKAPPSWYFDLIELPISLHFVYKGR